jgi:hypothetical protein
MKKLFSLFVISAILCFCTILFSQQTPTAFAKQTIHLFNSKNLDGWYTFLTKRGKNNDPEKVFSVQDRLLRISGQEWGCITTNEEYENYSLELEFKTGTKTYPPRPQNALDSGVLLHSVGEDGAFGGAWMKSIECNIIEGGCGDFIVVAVKGDESNFSLTTTVTPQSLATPKKGYDYDADGVETTIHSGRINRIGRDPEWRDVAGFRGQNEIENPAGQWNVIKCNAQRNTITIYLNGKFVNQATNVKPQKGRIQIQSEGAEYFFKRIDLTPL